MPCTPTMLINSLIREVISVNFLSPYNSKIMKNSFYLILLLLAWSSDAQSIQEKLGYSKDTKLLIIHADDIGVSHSENRATILAMEKGSVNSGSILVPCPWFPEIADYAKAHPEMDFGLHLALTSEWKFYKWGPVAGAQAVPGLVDVNRFLYPDWDGVRNHASAEEVEKELRAQITTAQKYGINITHLDSHMMALFLKPEYIEAYQKVGKEFKLPILMTREFIEWFEMDPAKIIGPNDIVIDRVYMASSEDYKKGMKNYYTEVLRGLKPGLNEILLHAAYNDEEMKAVTVGFVDYGAAWRQDDFDFFTSDACKQLLKEEKIQLITWKEIKTKLIK